MTQPCRLCPSSEVAETVGTGRLLLFCNLVNQRHNADNQRAEQKELCVCHHRRPSSPEGKKRLNPSKHRKGSPGKACRLSVFYIKWIILSILIEEKTRNLWKDRANAGILLFHAGHGCPFDFREHRLTNFFSRTKHLKKASNQPPGNRDGQAGNFDTQFCHAKQPVNSPAAFPGLYFPRQLCYNNVLFACLPYWAAKTSRSRHF